MAPAAETKPVSRTRVVKISVYAACAALIVGGAISVVLNILSFFDPTLPVLSAYMCIFGIIILGAELNLSKIRTYFGFLHDWIGEAVFFIFVGSLGVACGTNGLVAFIIGIISCVVGVMCIVDHFMCTRKLFFAQTDTPVS